MVALVGPSGAGKTTITHLVARLYDVRPASVRVGGHDVRDVTLESLQDVGRRRHPGRPHVPRHDPRQPALRPPRRRRPSRLGGARGAPRSPGWSPSLPDGLDTVVGDRGYRLSGGEKQRLAIARLLLKAPAVVVLDEATAHLDSESEAAVQRALDTALEGRTSPGHRAPAVDRPRRRPDPRRRRRPGRRARHPRRAARRRRPLRRPLPHPVHRRPAGDRGHLGLASPTARRRSAGPRTARRFRRPRSPRPRRGSPPRRCGRACRRR